MAKGLEEKNNKALCPEAVPGHLGGAHKRTLWDIGVHTKGCSGTWGTHKRTLWDRLLGRCTELLSIPKEINAQEI